MDPRTQLVINTCPNEDVAMRLAAILVEERLAACVNIVPAVTSVYMWKEQKTVDKEVLLLIKTTEEAVARLTERLVAEHPYELPEVVAVSIDGGLPAYLAWIKNEVKVK